MKGRLEDMELALQKLKMWLDEAKIVTFFGGAGVSTESGLPDYRSQDGTYSTMQQNEENPRYIMSRQYIVNHPEKFFNRPQAKREQPIEPNPAHNILAKWEQAGKDIRIITQNVDGLHQKAGHRFVIELHGNGRTWYCMTCGRNYLPSEAPRDKDNVPRCYIDQGLVRPSVVFFGENPNPADIEKSIETIKMSDLLIIAGTSLSVYPAKNLIHHFNGAHVIVINRESIDTGKTAVDLFIKGDVGDIMTRLDQL